MANTYYDSQLTAAEIEAALEAIDGVIVPANNGKVLAINNGKLEARSVQWGGGGAAIQPLSVTQNGTYTPPSGVDGYAPVVVNVSGGSGSNSFIKNVSIITAPDIITEFDACADVVEGSATGLQEAGTHILENKYRTANDNILFADLGAENTSGTIYAVIKALTSDGDYGGIVFDYNWYNGTAPMFYTRSNTWLTGAFGQDQSTGISSNVFRVLALAVNGTSKTARHFIGDQKIRDDVTFTNSGRYGSWGGGYSNTGVIQAANSFEVAYGAVVRGVETDQEILDNMAAIATAYASILGT